MKFKELNEMNSNELKENFERLKLELIKAKIKKNGTKIKEIKKILARIKTLESIKKIESGGKK